MIEERLDLSEHSSKEEQEAALQHAMLELEANPLLMIEIQGTLLDTSFIFSTPSEDHQKQINALNEKHQAIDRIIHDASNYTEKKANGILADCEEFLGEQADQERDLIGKEILKMFLLRGNIDNIANLAQFFEVETQDKERFYQTVLAVIESDKDLADQYAYLFAENLNQLYPETAIQFYHLVSDPRLKGKASDKIFDIQMKKYTRESDTRHMLSLVAGVRDEDLSAEKIKVVQDAILQHQRLQVGRGSEDLRYELLDLLYQKLQDPVLIANQITPDNKKFYLELNLKKHPEMATQNSPETDRKRSVSSDKTEKPAPIIEKDDSSVDEYIKSAIQYAEYSKGKYIKDGVFVSEFPDKIKKRINELAVFNRQLNQHSGKPLPAFKSPEFKEAGLTSMIMADPSLRAQLKARLPEVSTEFYKGIFKFTVVYLRQKIAEGKSDKALTRFENFKKLTEGLLNGSIRTEAQFNIAKKLEGPDSTRSRFAPSAHRSIEDMLDYGLLSEMSKTEHGKAILRGTLKELNEIETPAKKATQKL